MIFLLLIWFSCNAHEVETLQYTKNLNILIEQWVDNPTPKNYWDLNFYMRANKPASPIIVPTEAALLKKIENGSFSNHCPKKAAAAIFVTSGSIFLVPKSCGCALISCAIMSGDMLRTCHQDNKPALAEELKTEFQMVCAKSRMSSTALFPQSMSMSKA